MKALVSLETISAIPVTTTFYQGTSSFNGLLSVDAIVEEEPDADEGEDNIDFGS
jgi:hypothetical protein